MNFWDILIGNFMRKSIWIIIISILIPLNSLMSNASEFVEGEDDDYSVLQKPISEYKDTVIEFFSYACPYCYRAESPLDQFKQTLPKNIKFIRIAVTLGREKHLISSQVWFLSQKLGFDENFHIFVFNVVHAPIGKELTYNQLKTIEDVNKLFTDNGIKPESYRDALTLIQKEGLVEKADQIAQAFLVVGTPTVIIKGKYVINGMKSGPNAEKRYVELLKYLMAL